MLPSVIHIHICVCIHVHRGICIHTYMNREVGEVRLRCFYLSPFINTRYPKEQAVILRNRGKVLLFLSKLIGLPGCIKAESEQMKSLCDVIYL